MDISLTPELEQFIEETVKTGRYRSVSDLINLAVSLLKDEENLDEEGTKELRRLVTVGVEEADRGDLAPWDAEEIKAEGRRRLAERRKPR